MNTKDKQKAMLADDLSLYIKDKHTQEECTGFIDGYNAALTKLKLLSIANVVGGEAEQLVCECGEKPKDVPNDGYRYICKKCNRPFAN